MWPFGGVDFVYSKGLANSDKELRVFVWKLEKKEGVDTVPDGQQAAVMGTGAHSACRNERKKKNEGQVQNLLHKIVVKYVANGGKWDIRFHSLCYYYTAVHVILVTRTGRQPAVDVGGARKMKSACE